MPQTKFQKLFFMFLTVLLSVHAFVIYNIAISMGSMSNQVFLLARKEVPLEFVIAFLVEALFAARLAEKMAFRMVDPRTDKPIVIILAITCSTVLIMCPTMSFAATIIYNGININFVANWMQKIVYNFPFAFFTQIFFIGPVVRIVSRCVFKNAHSEKKIGNPEPDQDGEELDPEFS